MIDSNVRSLFIQSNNTWSNQAVGDIFGYQKRYFDHTNGFKLNGTEFNPIGNYPKDETADSLFRLKFKWSTYYSENSDTAFYQLDQDGNLNGEIDNKGLDIYVYKMDNEVKDFDLIFDYDFGQQELRKQAPSTLKNYKINIQNDQKTCHYITDFKYIEPTLTFISKKKSYHSNIYPNPIQSGYLHLSTTQNWKLYDSMGQLLNTGSSKQINMDNYSVGTYILQTENGREVILKQ